jgi:hypothetical protein
MAMILDDVRMIQGTQNLNLRQEIFFNFVMSVLVYLNQKTSTFLTAEKGDKFD